jgi:signal transduction histidine kinase
MPQRATNEMPTLSPRWGAITATAALLVGLVLVNAAATREIIHARAEARRMARHELVLRLEREAQSLRAELADLRTDLITLAESPPLQELPTRIASPDRLVQRWAQRDAEGSLLLFVQARPALTELRLEIGEAAAPIVIGRIDGVVQTLDAGRAPPVATPHLVTMHAVLPGSSDGALRGWVDPRLVLRQGDGADLETLAFEDRAPAEAEGNGLVAAVRINDERWEPAIDLWLVARQMESPMERSVESLAGSYRRTVIWNLVVILAVSAAVALALAQMRRRVRAEAAAEHEREVRELERSLLHSERLATVGRFAAGVAHEVNNPLEGMGNYLSLLAGDLEAGDSAAARDRLPKVREGLDRAAAIVRRVLTFSDPARSPKEICDLGDPVREAVDFLRPRFPDVDMEVSAPAASPVLANRVALSQLFLNILLNACEGQEEGGEVAVAVAGYDTTVVATIADRGPGLSDETLDHLFEPFYSSRGGSGLGLSVCHGIVRDHGGEISVANRAGGGAVFEVRLPRAGRADQGAA